MPLRWNDEQFRQNPAQPPLESSSDDTAQPRPRAILVTESWSASGVVSASMAMTALRALPAALMAAVAGASAAEGPDYAVVSKYVAFEVRQYAPYVVAEVTVPGPADEVGRQGFSLLSAYIFGANQGRRSLAMTTPVTNTPVPVRLAMTAPVTQSADRARGGFIVQFTMPRGETLDTLPTPDNARVRLRELPGELYAVIAYSGRWTQANDQEHADALRKAAAEAGLNPVGEPVVARYNAPFVPPPLRHNEVWLSVAP